MRQSSWPPPPPIGSPPDLEGHPEFEAAVFLTLLKFLNFRLSEPSVWPPHLKAVLLTLKEVLLTFRLSDDFQSSPNDFLSVRLNLRQPSPILREVLVNLRPITRLELVFLTLIYWYSLLLTLRQSNYPRSSLLGLKLVLPTLMYSCWPLGSPVKLGAVFMILRLSYSPRCSHFVPLRQFFRLLGCPLKTGGIPKDLGALRDLKQPSRIWNYTLDCKVILQLLSHSPLCVVGSTCLQAVP
jgi:hypothetical protein